MNKRMHNIWNISIIPALPSNPDANPPVVDVAAIQTTSAKFQINNAKFMFQL